MTLAQVQLDPITGLSSGYQGLGTANAPTTLETIISNSIGFITIAAGITFVMYLVLGGLTWITARDDSGRMDRAKQMITNALVGLFIVVVAWAFAGVMQTIFGFNILNPAEIINCQLVPGRAC